MTYAEACARLRSAGVPDAAWDAACLIEQFCGVSRAALRGDGGRDYASPALTEAVERRAAREPLQYLLGRWDFYRETYRVGPGCLIPRADTEMLVDYAVRILAPGGRFLDLCTGSGCIAISTLAARPDCTADAVDRYDAPLAYAAENAGANGVADRLRLWQGDVLAGFRPPVPDGGYAAILSNPPYIAHDVMPGLAPELAFEPATALDGGEDGLLFYRAMLRHYRDALAAGGCFVFEIGYDQASALRALAAGAGMDCTIQCDYGGCDRMAVVTPRS